ncbi:MAG: DegT/DnrJ/EryC1/StrS family aminotransferase [Planctomycetes bacterium]|nr:DegT/DnrJ/EryC1/StrS family aminotransferase [Planctomycetota bacterium]
MNGKQGKIDWWRPVTASPRARELLGQVIDSDYPNEGVMVEAFEKELKGILGAEHVVATTSGTAALYLSLKSLDIGPGDEVIVPDMTFIATANAVAMTGARAVLADIEEETLGLDPAAFLRAITPRTRAVIPVHVSGRAARITDIVGIAAEHGIFAVEDAAEAFASKKAGRFLGNFGRLGAFSFSPNKILTTGQGGAVITADAGLAGRLRERKDQGRPVRGTGGNDEHPTLGFNFKLTDLQGALGLAQLELLTGRLNALRSFHRLYLEGLGNLPGLRLFPSDLSAGESPLWTDALIEKRDALADFLSAEGIGTRKFWYPLHTQPPYRQEDSAFPVATFLAPRLLWLPSAYTLDGDSVKLVCARIREFLGRE